ncbi:MAG: amidohydrolase family protein [Clostridia bacterium]|nr:amidohydrolase family protein [Clostridia bacterium]
MLYFNGKILTDEGVKDTLFVRNGVIDSFCAPDGYEGERFDLKGRAMTSAFYDAHGHIAAFARSLAYVSLRDATSIEEIEFLLKNAATSGGVIIGFGYDSITPTKELLDAVSPLTPVIAAHSSGHMGVINSAAQKLFNVDKSELSEEEFMLLSSKIPESDATESAYLMDKAQQIYASNGYVLAQEGLASKSELDFLSRSRIYLDVRTFADMRRTENGRCDGYKIILDGSPQGKTAYLSRPYKGTNNYGHLAMSDDEVLEYMRKSRGKQLLVHANGDAAIEQFLRCLEKVPLHRSVLIHAQLIRQEQIERAVRMGVIISFFSSHTYYWGDAHIKNLGERARTISPLRSALDAGAVCTLHQDAPVTMPNMLETLCFAVERVTRGGILLGANERVNIEQAFCCATKNCAYQYGEEAFRGKIAAGCEANFIVLSQSGESIDATFLRGQKIYG